MDIANLSAIAAFVATGLACWAVVQLLSGRKKQYDERMDELRKLEVAPRAVAPREKSEVESFVKSAAPLLAKPMRPKDQEERHALKMRLANAGFNSAHAVELFLAIRFVSMLACMFVGFIIGFAWLGALRASLAAVGGAAIGLFLPEGVRAILASGRKRRIFRSLPDALDLLIIAIEVGLGLDAALRRVGSYMKDYAPDLVEEINLYSMHVQMGRARRDALHDLGIRSGIEDMNSLTALLIQADRFGSGLAETLRQQSESMRVRRRQDAEERAQQTAVKLIFPLVLFIFPGIFVVLIGPAAITIMHGMLGVD